MDSATAHRILDGIMATRLDGLRDQVLRGAIRYAEIRATWFLLAAEGRREADQGRRIAQDAFIDALNCLSRNMVAGGEVVEWRRELGSDRQVIGDLAYHLACLLGLKGR